MFFRKRKYACKDLNHGGPLIEYIRQLPFEELCSTCQYVLNTLLPTPSPALAPDSWNLPVKQTDAMVSSSRSERLSIAFRDAERERFESGYNSRFTDRLDKLYEEGGDFFLMHLRHFLVKDMYRETGPERYKPHVIAESVSWAYRQGFNSIFPRTRFIVYSILIEALYHDDIDVNDVALSGLLRLVEDEKFDSQLDIILRYVTTHNENYKSETLQETVNLIKEARDVE